MSKIAIAKSSESGNYVKAMIPGILFFVCGLAWMTALNGAEAFEPAINYALMGGTLILLILTVAMAVKYESNRHEVYF